MIDRAGLQSRAKCSSDYHMTKRIGTLAHSFGHIYCRVAVTMMCTSGSFSATFLSMISHHVIAFAAFTGSVKRLVLSRFPLVKKFSWD